MPEGADPLVLNTRLAFLVVASSFLGLASVMGCYYSFGIFYVALKKDFQANASHVALVGSVSDSVFNLLCIPIGYAIPRAGFMAFYLAGGCIFLCGLVVDTLMPSIPLLICSHGLIVGTGLAFVFMPLGTISAGRVPKRWLPVVGGIIFSGTGVGTVLWNLVLDKLLLQFTWRSALRFVAGGCAASLLLVCAGLCVIWRAAPSVEKSVSKPSEVLPTESSDDAVRAQAERSSRCFGKTAQVIISFLAPLARKRVIGLLIALSFHLFGHMVPYTHLPYYAEEVRGASQGTGASLMVTMGILSFVGRLVCGFAASLSSALSVFTLCVFMNAIAMFMLSVAQRDIHLFACAATFGFFGGGRAGILMPVVAELFGADQVPHLYGLTGFSFIVAQSLGPPLVGRIFDATGRYDTAFIVVGSVTIISAPILLLLRCPEKAKDAESPNREAAVSASEKELEVNC